MIYKFTMLHLQQRPNTREIALVKMMASAGMDATKERTSDGQPYLMVDECPKEPSSDELSLISGRVKRHISKGQPVVLRGVPSTRWRWTEHSLGMFTAGDPDDLNTRLCWQSKHIS